jgi:hypothetical protein
MNPVELNSLPMIFEKFSKDLITLDYYLAQYSSSLALAMKPLTEGS